MSSGTSLELNEKFPPPKEFAQRAAISSMEQYERMYKDAFDDPDKFWAERAAAKRSRSSRTWTTRSWIVQR
jgi:acetyl-CoA synthetase